MSSSSNIYVVTLMGAVMFVAGFQFSLTIAIASPLVKRCLSLMYSDQYSIDHHGLYTSGLIAASNLCNAFVNPFWGRSVDKHGRRPILLIALGSAAISMTLFAATHQFWIALASRIFIGLFDSSLFISKVVIGDISNLESAGRNFSSIYTCFALSQTISPLMASLFESHNWYPSLGPCLLAAIVTMIVFLSILLYLPETSVDRSTKDVTAWRNLMATRSILVPVCLYAMLAMVLTSAEAATSYIITEKRAGLSLGSESIGRLFTIQGVGYILTQLFICPWLIATAGAKSTFRICTMSLLVIYPCCVLPAWTSTPFLFMAIQMLIKVIITSSAVTAATILINDSTDLHNRGIITSIAQSGAGIARSIGLVLIGIVYDYAAARSMISIPYLVLGVSGAIVSLASLFLVQPNLHTSGNKQPSLDTERSSDITPAITVQR